jgi:hypothetical protein
VKVWSTKIDILYLESIATYMPRHLIPVFYLSFLIMPSSIKISLLSKFNGTSCGVEPLEIEIRNKIQKVYRGSTHSQPVG